MHTPGIVGGGDRRGALHGGDERRLQIEQVTVQIGNAGEREGRHGERDSTDERLWGGALCLNEDGRQRAVKGEGVYLLADSEERKSSGV